jgi:hypothetical protein
MARVQVVNSITDPADDKSSWHLALQWCRYWFDDGHWEHGYRFIWITPKGRLQPARGQARLPSFQKARRLMEFAEQAGWGGYNADNLPSSAAPAT